MSLDKLTFKKGSYFEAEDVINEVFIPCMKNSNNLNILAAYFTIDSLLEIAEGLEEFIHNEGKVSVVVSVPETGAMNPHDVSLLKAHTDEFMNNDYHDFEKQLLAEALAPLVICIVLKSSLILLDSMPFPKEKQLYQDKPARILSPISSLNPNNVLFPTRLPINCWPPASIIIKLPSSLVNLNDTPV